ncbi:NAD(P)-dependent oxidoreductase [Georgenia yuyongxinii]|uniref:NAD-dependent epimerase/dehydratase family protein n=1 Tax=Georgenia yuyongxinii TaxID=2589797 RepID=A0A552WV22_9MICO|nr:NAD-dependent epimerase/dehydratase family protein [Georgenia yuyongxinii]
MGAPGPRRAMKIALLGGTGRTGRHVLDRALGAGHDVVALTRAGTALPDRTGLETVSGDARDAVTLRQLVVGTDAVASALGPRGRDAGLQTAVARAVVDAMATADVRRFVGVSVAYGPSGRPQGPPRQTHRRPRAHDRTRRRRGPAR